MTFSPRDFLQTRRPERFSDSDVSEVTDLDRSLLEYHLDSLTARGQETEFEHFAKRLCEAEVCPNLVAHTGPDAGGDAKADTQTFPVADALALTWYVGVGREGDTDAARERWAFAVSTQQTWREKVRGDIAKIVATTRGYTKAFFVSNQAIRDKDRAAVEDDLSKTHGIDVRILDRNWILDRVFSNRREIIAVEELGISGLSRTEARTGPHDARREEDLATVEARIEAAAQSQQFTPATVDDLRVAAIIARELDRPRDEVEGRFRRAQKLARKVGTLRQQVEAAYQWAWTLYFYLNEPDDLPEAYDAVAALAKGSRNVCDFERLINLWTLLHSGAQLGHVGIGNADLEVRREALDQELDRLAQEPDRPSTALQARVLRIELDILTRAGDPAVLFAEFTDVIREAAPLVGFPLDPIVRVFIEEGAGAFEDTPGYDAFFEFLVAIEAERDGETRAASLLLDRGRAQAEAGRHYDAVATLGRALARLSKEEARDAFAEALYLCGHALDALGLPWAARGLLLAAASVATDERWREGHVTMAQASAYRRLKWVELRLGRVPQALAWHRADIETRDYLAQRGEDPDELARLHREFDRLFGSLLLRSADLNALRSLPDTLVDLDLRLAAIALLFGLGHESPMEALASSQGEPGEDAEAFASRWLRESPSDWETPGGPHLHVGTEPVTLVSRTAGCEFRVTSDPSPACVNVAEAVLGGIEGLLATAPVLGGAAFEPSLHVHVCPGPLGADDPPFSISIEEADGRPLVTLTVSPFDPIALTLDDQAQLKQATIDAIVQIVPRAIALRNSERDLPTLLGDERALDRAVYMSGVYGARANVLGPGPQFTLAFWEGSEVYDVLREGPWVPDAESRLPERDPTTDSRAAESPTDHFDPSPLIQPRGHRDLATVSHVRESLWEKARWSWVAFGWDPGGLGLPIFGLIFDDLASGQDVGFPVFRPTRN